VKQHCNFIYLFNLIYAIYYWGGKAEFLASLLEFSLSNNLVEIILRCCFGAQETFIIIINIEKSCAA